MTDQFTTQIAAGAAVLDERNPGWYREIDLDTLELSDCRFCVIGQLWGEGENSYASYSTYSGAIQVLMGREGNFTVTRPWAIAHGFDLPEGDDPPWEDLTDEWREFISARLAEVPC